MKRTIYFFGHKLILSLLIFSISLFSFIKISWSARAGLSSACCDPNSEACIKNPSTPCCNCRWGGGAAARQAADDKWSLAKLMALEAALTRHADGKMLYLDRATWKEVMVAAGGEPLWTVFEENVRAIDQEDVCDKTRGPLRAHPATAALVGAVGKTNLLAQVGATPAAWAKTVLAIAGQSAMLGNGLPMGTVKAALTDVYGPDWGLRYSAVVYELAKATYGDQAAAMYANMDNRQIVPIYLLVPAVALTMGVGGHVEAVQADQAR